MPTVRIPLIGVSNARTIDGEATLVAGKDQRFVNCTFSIVPQPDGKVLAYLQKRPGWKLDSIVEAGSVSTGVIRTPDGVVVTAFGATNSTLYDSQISIGTITGRAIHFTTTLISGVQYILIRSSDGTGWYYPADARDQTSYTGDTHTNTIIDGIASTAGMYSGQAVSGTGIQAGTRISSVTSSTAIVVDTATTGTATVTITKTPVAKILDADFVTTGEFISKLVGLDGYTFYCATDGYLYNSDLNSVTAYSAVGKLAVQSSSDEPVAVLRNKSTILVFGTDSIDVFENAGNPTGSPMRRVAGASTKIGALDQKAICEISDDIYFVTSACGGNLQIRHLPGLEVVSTPEIDNFIGTISTDADMYLSGFSLGGYPYVSVYVTTTTGGTDLLLLETGDNLLLETGDNIQLETSIGATSSFGRHFLYNTKLKIWSEWDSYIPTYVFGECVGTNNQLMATSRVTTDGYLYTINPVSDGELHTDAGAAFTMTVTTTRIDHGTNKRKFISAVRLIGDTQESGTASLSYSDDDYATFSTPRTFDMTAMQPEITRLGSYKGGRVYKLTHSADTPFRAQALEIDYTVGQS